MQLQREEPVAAAGAGGGFSFDHGAALGTVDQPSRGNFAPSSTPGKGKNLSQTRYVDHVVTHYSLVD